MLVMTGEVVLSFTPSRRAGGAQALIEFPSSDSTTTNPKTKLSLSRPLWGSPGDARWHAPHLQSPGILISAHFTLSVFLY